MGSLILSASGPVHADARIFINSVERHPTYAPPLLPPWEAVSRWKWSRKRDPSEGKMVA
jgi:hypothetical protein